MQEQIETERLILRVLQEQDAEFIQSLLNSRGWLEFIGDRNIHSWEDAVQYINRIRQAPNFTYWVVLVRESNVPIGIISFLKRSYLEHFDIGFAFLPEFNGRGYAFESARKVLDHLSLKNGYHPILATTVPHNQSSIKLLNKLGLRFEREINVQNEKLHVYTT